VASGYDKARHAVAAGADAVKDAVVSAAEDDAQYEIRELEDLRVEAARVTRDVTTAVRDTATVVRQVARAVVSTAQTVVKRVVSTAKTVAKRVVSAAKTVVKHVVSAAKTVAKRVVSAAKTVAKHVVSAVKTQVSAVVSAGKAVASAAWSHRRGLLQIGMVAAAVGLTVVNVLQLGLDPATDALEGVDIGALAADAGEEGASIAAESAAEGAAESGADEAGADEAGTSAAGADEAGAEDPAADGQGSEDDPSNCTTSSPTPGGSSFAAGTLVLLAAGKALPISELKVGDKVLASDTRTGKDQPETVTAVLLHHDTDLYNLTVKTSGGTEVIHTTSSHLFWDPYHHYWISANKLSKGEHLKTANGTVAVADGGTVPADHDGWMWDLTVPGNNDHDFYVYTATVSILVHNCSDFAPGKALEHYQKHVLGVLNNGASKLGGADMPEFLDQGDYVAGAQDLLDGEPGDGVLEGVRANNDILRYDTNTGSFGVKTATGVIKTFFRPDGGEAYFRGLTGVAPLNY
jgi:hypothetical protein